jgi:uncharacterized protein (DUF488 family)
MTLFTIGFTKKTAEQFFETLKQNGIKKLIDIRLNNKSQLSGFAKTPDIEYFLKNAGIEYVYMPEFAPTKGMLDLYQAKKLDWLGYEIKYNLLLLERMPLNDKDADIFDRACLLCSENTADKCHRRLAAEYIANTLKGVRIVHL